MRPGPGETTSPPPTPAYEPPYPDQGPARASHHPPNGATTHHTTAIGLERNQRILDLASGKGELLCTWARDHEIVGTGVDLHPPFVSAAEARASELGVSDRVTFIHGDASTYVASEPVDITACVGATWIGSGVQGAIELLQRSLRPRGMMLIGEPYWRAEPPDQETIEGCYATSRDTFRLLPDLVQLFGALGYDLVEMVLADEDSWDRYAAAQWLSVRRFLPRCQPGRPDRRRASRRAADRPAASHPVPAILAGMGSLCPDGSTLIDTQHEPSRPAKNPEMPW